MFLRLRYMFSTDEKVYQDFLKVFLEFLTADGDRERVERMLRYVSRRPLVGKRVYNLIIHSKWQTK